MKNDPLISVRFSVYLRPYLKEVLKGVLDYSRRHCPDWQLDLPFYHSGLSRCATREGHADGVIMGVPDIGILEKVKAPTIPVVLVGWTPRPEQVSSIIFDYQEVAEHAVKHFQEQGVEQLAWFGSMDHLRKEHQQVRQAVLSHCAELGVECRVYQRNCEPRVGGQITLSQLDELGEWLKAFDRPAGVLCGDDDYADRLYAAASRAGKIPGSDFLVMSCGNDPVFCDSVSPGLSSVSLDYYGMGWLAAEKLAALLSNPDEPHEEKVVRSSELVLRRSSRRSGGGDMLVERAVQQIWEGDGFVHNVESLAEALRVNRRTLHRRFLATVGHSPSKEIRSARISRAQRLILENRHSLAEIAQDCGFSDQAHLTREIRKKTGFTPREIRQRQGKL